jgi:hypothetical protein
MILSRRSKILLLGSGLAPLGIGINQLESWQAQKHAEALGGYLMSNDPGLPNMGLVGLGIFSLITGIFSALIDFRRTR